MSFEQPPEQEIEKEESNIYQNTRERLDYFLNNCEFVKEEEIIEINPEKIKDETPVFFSPGWGVKATSESMRKAIAEEGRKVISTDFTREEKMMDTGNKEDIPVAELQKALAIIETLNKTAKGKVDAIGHSEGGLNLAVAASLYPEKFRNIVLISPAGMMEKDSYLSLVKRFVLDEGIEELKKTKGDMNSFYAYAKGVIGHVVSGMPLLD